MQVPPTVLVTQLVRKGPWMSGRVGTGPTHFSLLPAQSSLRSSPCGPWGPNSAWSSRRSSWNSLGRAPSLKRRSQCGERESLLSGEGKGSTDEEAEDGRPGAGASPGSHTIPLRRAESLDHRSALDLRPPRPAALLPAKLPDCNGQALALPREFFLRIDSHKEDSAEFDDDMEDVSGGRPHASLLSCVCSPRQSPRQGLRAHHSWGLLVPQEKWGGAG